MRVTIAGYGSIGHYVASLLGEQHDLAFYDPPMGLDNTRLLTETDYVVVCVPTPMHDDGSCETTIVEEVVANANPAAAIVCHSTVAIGTTERLIETYDKPLVFVPEYAGESAEHPYRDPRNVGFMIYGGYEPALSRAEALYASVLGPETSHHRTDPTTAELVKYMENSFLALKVGFCNEIFDLGSAVGVDYEEARRLWLLDGRVGISHTEVTAERGFGGKCLPKDLAALVASGHDQDQPMQILSAVLDANVEHRRRGGRSLTSTATR